MMYSIVPDGMIFSNNGSQVNKTEILSYNGQLIEVRECNGRQVVNRLFSTEPSQFLQNCFQPGANVSQPK